MKTKKWTFIDKSEWGNGPWQEEPDKVQFSDKNTGLPCLIVRNSSGSLCGYVGVSSTHPFYKKPYHQIDDVISVHGGLTFSDKCQEDRKHGICHVVENGESDDVWWLGFDCGHCMDLSPAFQKYFHQDLGEEYRTMKYVKTQIKFLAKQLNNVTKRKELKTA